MYREKMMGALGTWNHEAIVVHLLIIISRLKSVSRSFSSSMQESGMCNHISGFCIYIIRWRTPTRFAIHLDVFYACSIINIR